MGHELLFASHVEAQPSKGGIFGPAMEILEFLVHCHGSRKRVVLQVFRAVDVEKCVARSAGYPNLFLNLCRQIETAVPLGSMTGKPVEQSEDCSLGVPNISAPSALDGVYRGPCCR